MYGMDVAQEKIMSTYDQKPIVADNVGNETGNSSCDTGFLRNETVLGSTTLAVMCKICKFAA